MRGRTALTGPGVLGFVLGFVYVTYMYVLSTGNVAANKTRLLTS